MRNWGWLLIGLGSWCSLACSGGQSRTAGGQSGTEGSTPACANFQHNEIGLDDSTPFGTARQLFSDAMMFSMQQTSMRWNSPTDGSSFDTFITYDLSGTPTHAVYTVDPAPNCAAGWDLSVDGAILHFQSADGAFNESVSGSLFVMHSGSNSPQATQFWGHPATPFVGSYDIDSATKKFAHPIVQLEAPMGPGSGDLGVIDQAAGNFTIATWQNVAPSGAAGSTGSAGASGAGNASYGGSAVGGGADVVGESGSGGTTTISDNGGEGGAARGVAPAGTGAGGAAENAGSGGSN
jgi:hypothetical protein